MKFWIEWTAIYEGFTYSETVNEKELADRLCDDTINITLIEPLDQSGFYLDSARVLFHFNALKL